MADSDVRIPVSSETRRQLRILKGQRDVNTYDELLRDIIADVDVADGRGGVDE